jgi:hypothetical protein
MRDRILLFCGAVVLLAAGFWTGRRAPTAHAQAPMHGSVPKSYGSLVTAISDSIGTGIIFEDSDGKVRFVSITGMKEGELARY